MMLQISVMIYNASPMRGQAGEEGDGVHHNEGRQEGRAAIRRCIFSSYLFTYFSLLLNAKYVYTITHQRHKNSV